MNALLKPSLVAPCFLGFDVKDMEIMEGAVVFSLVSGCVSIECEAKLDSKQETGSHDLGSDNWIDFSYSDFSITEDTPVVVIGGDTAFSNIAIGQVLALTSEQLSRIENWLRDESFELELERQLHHIAMQQTEAEETAAESKFLSMQG